MNISTPQRREIAQLEAERARLVSEQDDLITRNGDDPSTWDEGHATRAENVLRSIDRIDDKILVLRAEQERAESHIRAVVSDPSNLSRPPSSLDGARSRTSTTRTRHDPWAGLERSGSVHNLDTDEGLRSRAVDAVATFTELSEDAREALTRALDKESRDKNLSRFILTVGQDAYRGAFEKWLQSPETASMDSTPQELAAWRDVSAMRAALDLSGGAALLPLVLDPSINLTNTGSMGEIRRYASHDVTVSSTFRAVKSAGVNAEWKVEGAEAVDATPTLSSSTSRCGRASSPSPVPTSCSTTRTLPSSWERWSPTPGSAKKTTRS